jgi:hypothetical protein
LSRLHGRLSSLERQAGDAAPPRRHPLLPVVKDVLEEIDQTLPGQCWPADRAGYFRTLGEELQRFPGLFLRVTAALAAQVAFIEAAEIGTGQTISRPGDLGSA